jgi:hypothetical protein
MLREALVIKLTDAPVRSLNSLRRFMAPSEIGDCALEEVAAVMIKPGNQALHQEFELPRRVARQPDTAAQGTGWFFRIPILTNASVAELLSRPRPASSRPAT